MGDNAKIVDDDGSERRSFWQKKVLCILTGASKGLGKATALAFANSFSEAHKARGTPENGARLSFVLIARNRSALDQVSKVLDASSPFAGSTVVIQGSLDQDKTIQSSENVIESLGKESFDQVILIHNAGSLGNPKQLVNEFSCEDLDTLSLYFKLNVTSVVALTGIFLRTFEKVTHRTIINISSLAALSALKGLSVYCTGKAARDAFFRSVALEHPDIRVLNYAPGPVRTEMADTLRTNSFMQEFFEKDENVLKPEDTVAKLVTILDANTFISGSHVDYFD